MMRSNKPKMITPEMTILDIVSRYRETEAVLSGMTNWPGHVFAASRFLKVSKTLPFNTA
jgi:hypothetical protein